MSDHLIDLAKRAGFTGVRTTWSDVKTSHSTLHNKTYAELARFTELVRDEERKECAEHYLKIMRDAINTAIADEREACAQACETLAGPVELYNQGYHHYLDCAAAIRARRTE